MEGKRGGRKVEGKERWRERGREEKREKGEGGKEKGRRDGEKEGRRDEREAGGKIKLLDLYSNHKAISNTSV